MSRLTETISPTARETAWVSNGQCVILHDVSWETYERLLVEHEENSGTHFTYNQGMLEIMVLSARHESLKHILALLVDLIAAELNVDLYGLGSTTFQREDLARGFEPDACFYIANEAAVRGKAAIDLTIDPPPDLVIEIDITSPSLNKFPIFATLGVTEVWRYDGEQVHILALQGDQYVVQPESIFLPPVTGKVLTELVAASQSLKRTAWLRRVREWAQVARKASA
ncbi:MAG: Uma2 family endonuclease [Caldilineaceae bacterium]